jgi:predicted RNase H-like HicB family nuclease
MKLTKHGQLRSFAAYPRCSADLGVDERSRPAYSRLEDSGMRSFNFVVERDPDTGLFVGHVPGWPGAHSQGESLDELQRNLQEAVAMLLEDGEPKLESEFVGVQTINVA